MPFTLPLGSKAPPFQLLAADLQYYSLDDFTDAKGYITFFTCNHCPYVIGSNKDTKRLAQTYQDQGIVFIAINSNSPNTYPEDSFEHMVKIAQEERLPWPYLHDIDQDVAEAYGALKTPHFFFFDSDKNLIYTGRAIDNPRDYTKAKVHDLEKAIKHHRL